MSTKFQVYPIGVHPDPDRKWNVMTANSGKGAVMVFAIREWGLFHCAEEEYNVYDMKGNFIETYIVPDWIDDQSAKVIKDAFHVEVLVERNETGYGESDLEAVKKGGQQQGLVQVMAQLTAAPVLPDVDEKPEV